MPDAVECEHGTERHRDLAILGERLRVPVVEPEPRLTAGLALVEIGGVLRPSLLSEGQPRMGRHDLGAPRVVQEHVPSARRERIENASDCRGTGGVLHEQLVEGHRVAK